ncbi:hypothetical protein ACFFX0_05110 [Citricoccus parietis]|uniref:Uncharacterized protein n=1 Tax=Citricoccus parietis TaxID=592307 RepID=A0ABV5FVA3_9MICC
MISMAGPRSPTPPFPVRRPGRVRSSGPGCPLRSWTGGARTVRSSWWAGTVATCSPRS